MDLYPKNGSTWKVQGKRNWKYDMILKPLKDAVCMKNSRVLVSLLDGWLAGFLRCVCWYICLKRKHLTCRVLKPIWLDLHIRWNVDGWQIVFNEFYSHAKFWYFPLRFETMYFFISFPPLSSFCIKGTQSRQNGCEFETGLTTE